MSAIFISHSSKDAAVAADVKERLAAQGHRSVFLDFDPADGIPAGRDWEQELYQRIRASRAVIVLCSRHSMASRWCFMEITHARALGKHLFPVKIDDCTIDGVLTDRQVIDLTVKKEEAFERLWRGILAAGLDPADAFDWDGSRPPYPGLLAFQEEDAGVFFGRDEEIGDGLDLLNKVHRLGETGLVMVLGASGTGKSSLVRAGLVPRLRRDVERWLVVEPFRPRDDPARELAAVLSRAFDRAGAAVKPDHLERRLRAAMVPVDLRLEEAAAETGADSAERQRFLAELRSLEAALPEDAGPRASRYLRLLRSELTLGETAQDERGRRTDNALCDMAAELRLRSGRLEAKVLLVVDQFEELLGHPDDHPGSRFLELLRAALDRRDTSLLVLGTLRSDFLGQLQKSPALLDVRYESLSLGPMSPEDVAQVIEKPALTAAIDLEPGLVRALTDDAGTEDALPLLAFTLRELYERYGRDGLLELGEYRERLGGLQGAVAKAADEVLADAELRPDDELRLRNAFLSMVRIAEEGGYARRPASWDALPREIHPLLEKFVQARLLISGGDAEARTLEVAHEALFRSWGRLVRWLDQNAEALRLRHEIQRAAHSWDQAGRAEEDLWRGGRLARARELISSGDLPLEELDLAFVEASDAAERARAEAEERRRRLVLRVVLGGAIVSLALALVAAGFALDARRQRRDAEERARQAEIARKKAFAAQSFAEFQRVRARAERAEPEQAKALSAIAPKYEKQSKQHLEEAGQLEDELAAWRESAGYEPEPPRAIFSLEVVRAEAGGCLIPHYGAPSEPRLLLVDGGSRRVYREHLRPRLAELRRKWPADGPATLDFVISTQADDSHSAGLVEFLKDLEEAGQAPAFRIRSLWSNAFLPDDEEARRAFAAVLWKADLVATARRLEIPVNLPFSRLVTLPEAGSARVHWRDDLSITVLGPSLEWLREFAPFWLKDLRRKVDKVGDAKTARALRHQLESFDVVEDFADERIELIPSPIEIVNPPTPEVSDQSFVNLASIVLMLEVGGKSMLLPADARSDTLLAALAQAGYTDAEGAMEVDLLALPHQGSDRNVSVDFFRRVKARHYVVQGEGRHGNPEVETFEMLFEARQGDSRPFTLYLSYRPEEYGERYPDYPVDELCALFERQREAGAPFAVVVPKDGEASVTIDLLLATPGLDKGEKGPVC